MLRLNRTTQYSLMALTYLRHQSKKGVICTREIAEAFGLPFEILAKTLQLLKELGFIKSVYGTRGGYVLSCELHKINLAYFIEALEGAIDLTPLETTQHQLVRSPLRRLNQCFYDFLSRISLAELTQPNLIDSITQAQNASNAESENRFLMRGEEP